MLSSLSFHLHPQKSVGEKQEEEVDESRYERGEDRQKDKLNNFNFNTPLLHWIALKNRLISSLVLFISETFPKIRYLQKFYKNIHDKKKKKKKCTKTNFYCQNLLSFY